MLDWSPGTACGNFPAGSKTALHDSAPPGTLKPMSTERRQKLLEKKRQLDAQIKALEARERQAERKRDTRRKVIAGALALEHAGYDEEFGQTLFRLLNRHVTRPQDRALFDLPEREEPEGADQDNAAPEQANDAQADPEKKRA